MATALNVDAGTYTINAKSDKTFTTSLGTTAVASGTWTLTDTTLSALISKELNAGGTALEDVTPYTLTFTVGSSNVLTLVSGENITPTPGPVTDATTTYTWVLDEELASLFVQSSALPDMTAGTYTIEILNNHFDAYFNNGTTAIESGYASVEDDSITLAYYLEFTVGENNVLTFVKPKFDVTILLEDGYDFSNQRETKVIKVALGDKIPQAEVGTPETYWYFDESLKGDTNTKYTFVYWYGNNGLEGDTENEDTQFDFDTIITDDYSLHAKWTETKYSPVNLYYEESMSFTATDTNAAGLVAEGDTVTFTVTPPENKKIAEGYPKVEDNTDELVDIEQVSEDSLKWTFTMPDNTVMIYMQYIDTNQ